jgi:putative phosphoribosyl transferase
MPKPALEQLVQIPVGGVRIEGMLQLPVDPSGVVVFAHGSGSSRHSPRNNFVAEALRANGLGTLLIDLLTVEEDRDVAVRFDIELLTSRLMAATTWVQQFAPTNRLRVGYFGASTGAAAALQAAARLGQGIGAVVARGGRPDLASDADLTGVGAPTLLLVGGWDTDVLALNRRALARLRCAKELVVVPGATHLFEEPGALQEVSRQAASWFCTHLNAPPTPPPE